MTTNSIRQSIVPRNKLFTPWKLGELELANRVVIPPLCMYRCGRDGRAGPFHHMHIGSMATSGAGLVILEATGVVPEGRISSRCMGLWNDEQAEHLKKIVDGVRTFSDTPISVQLIHAGRKGNDVPQTETPRTEKCPKDSEFYYQTTAPSAIAYDDTPNSVPHALTVEEIKGLVEAFASAAERADKIVGLCGIELHGAHGYLLHQFLSPLTNHRTDEYGGSFENRCRFLVEVFEAVRARVTPSKPVWVRLSATDWMEYSGQPSWDLKECTELCRRLEALGCAAIHVTSGGLHKDQRIPAVSGYQTSFALHIRRHVNIPVITVGLITDAHQAESTLQTKVYSEDGAEERGIDAVAVGRAFLFHPHWAYQAAYDLGESVVGVPSSYYRSEPFPHRDVFVRTFPPIKENYY